MATSLSVKQQEIRDREQAILKVARPMLLEGGYQRFSMDRIAAELRYAKGTIYNHFPNKEEIILALAVEAIQLRQAMFRKGLDYPGSPRERLQAIGVAFEMYVRNYPHYFRLEQIIRHDPVWDKASPQRRQLMLDCELECMGMLHAIVEAGVARGDLDFTPISNPAEMLFSLWGLSYGMYVLNQTSPSLASLGIHDVYRACRIASSQLMNGIPWRPIMNLEEDLRTYERIACHLFPEEVKKVPNFSLFAQG